MYIIMPNKLPNIRNTYPNYPKTSKEKEKAKANYNLVVAMQLLKMAPRGYIQNHTPPKPKRSRQSNSRASTTKKPRLPPGVWKDTTKNIGENFLGYDGKPFKAIDENAMKLERKLKRLHGRKTATSQVKIGGNVNIQQRKKAFEGKKNENTNGKAPARGGRLSFNQLARFEGAAPKPTHTPHSSRNKRVVLTVR